MTIQLSSLLDTDAEIIPWEKVDYSWIDIVEQATLSDTPPSYLIYPQTQDALAKVVEYANKLQWSILPCGNGSKLNWGGLVKNPQLVISTQHLNRIIDHAVGDLTVTVEAGVTLQQLQTLLQPHSQFLPLDPAYPDTATLGGIMATGDTGSWRQRYGGVRDMVLGLSFIRFDGKIAKGGGRVVKNVAGYDMMRLFTGSYGTLGIITQITFRLYPIHEASQTLLMTGKPDDISILAQTLRQSGITPTAAEILSSSLVQSLGEDGMGLMLRFQSIPESITEQIRQVKKIAQPLDFKSTIYADLDEISIWSQLQKSFNTSNADAKIVCKVGILPSSSIELLTKLEPFGLGMVNLGSGIGKLIIRKEGIEKMRSLCQNHQGYLSILESPKSIKQTIDPWGYNGNALDMMQKLKQKFDPNHLFSPNRFVGKI
ncbi:FAD-binding oxidoreductase [Aphanothece hegewaldii CCALA 016]|uniref:FAD-binding oxidoreductase n=1 Tax=Aphanothece hegewaldii CCALA 016 TaxID=2107694 RepID=A0A2T1M146_9CHRO|nr:FAD-binding oxidoreductase [Aphanothece hegewaldii]PSF38402.1 FAD-binding oxidoreductase [Aphanothece hegewaldii CCALA 016]